MEFLNQRLRKNQSELNIPLVSSVLTEVLAHCILVALIKIIKKKLQIRRMLPEYLEESKQQKTVLQSRGQDRDTMEDLPLLDTSLKDDSYLRTNGLKLITYMYPTQLTGQSFVFSVPNGGCNPALK